MFQVKFLTLARKLFNVSGILFIRLLVFEIIKKYICVCVLIKTTPFVINYTVSMVETI